MVTHKPIFGLLTDFGFDFSVASIKGVLLQAFRSAQVIDIDHSLEKFNLVNAAFVIKKVYRFFPKGTIFICVIDPGVGSEREILCIEIDGYTFIGPNNGIFHYLLKNKKAKIWRVNSSCFPKKSNTFHGRDLFAPIAIAVANNDKSFLEAIKPEHIITLEQLEEQDIITYIDSFGNIKTNIDVAKLTSSDTLEIIINTKKEAICHGRVFSQVKLGDLISYKGSNNTLEIAINQGSAKDHFNATVGDQIIINKKKG